MLRTESANGSLQSRPLDSNAHGIFLIAYTLYNSSLLVAGAILFSTVDVKGLTPILNVTDIASTMTWFEKWGWKKLWDWGTPPTFGAVGSGKDTCIFLCQGAQGGQGRGANLTTFQQQGDEQGDKGVWMSVWVPDVDEMHRQCIAAGLEVTFPPTDMPWNFREMHLRHPDGHVFRVSRAFANLKE